MELFAGIDLHSDNGYYGIVDKEGERVFQKKLPNDLKMVLRALRPFRKQLQGVAVESTYNWYWLVDGLMEQGYRMHLANPAAIQQYTGLKYSDDASDSFWLAEMLRFGILPEGYIYPKAERPLRDLLRRRMKLVQQRTSHILSFQSLVERNTARRVPGNDILLFREKYVKDLMQDEHSVLTGETNIAMIRFLSERIKLVEKAILKKARLKAEYEKLQTVPGIGRILALTIMYETGDIRRFSSPGNYASYCRCVRSTRISNNRCKGKGNQKNGNKYLSWAYVEAANFSKRYCPEARRFYQRKMAKTKVVVSIKALACKLSKACYFIMRDQVDFDVHKIFA